MNRISIIFSLLAISTTVFATPENYTLKCDTINEKVMLFTGQGFRDVLVVGKGTGADYLATFNVDAGNGLHYETLSPITHMEKGDSTIKTVFVDGTVELIYYGDGAEKHFNIIDSTGNHQCKMTGYNQDKIS